MHELSLVEALVDRLHGLAREHGARRVVRVVLEVGEFANAVPELLAEAYGAFRETDPLLAGSRLEVRPVPLGVRCRGCRARFRPEGYRFVCPRCGSGEVEVVEGEELLLRDVELEVEAEGGASRG